VTRTQLSPADQAQVTALVQRATNADGINPLNEQAVLGLTVEGCHILACQTGELIGYATVSDDSAQLVVDPACRRRGVGTGLLAATKADQVWAFGDLAPAQGFCAAQGFGAVRELLVMQARPTQVTRPTKTVPGVRIAGFVPSDLDELVALNARAFHDHPEQGRLTRQDFLARMDQPWFDPAGLLIARDAGGTMCGFHWTKAEDRTGEVYVIAVDPGRSGHGLGRVLLDAGLAYLADRGVVRTLLWVDGDNRIARNLYDNSGFSVVRRDVQYRKVDSDARRQQGIPEG